jgi:hypothetical protein
MLAETSAASCGWFPMKTFTQNEPLTDAELDHLHFGKSFWRRMFSVPPLSARELHESYKKATDRRIFISPSTMAKSLGALSKSFEVSAK